MVEKEETMFWILFGGWLVFVGLLTSGFIPTIPLDLKVIGGTFMVVFGVWIVTGTLYDVHLNSKPKKIKE
jgi:hypothetical protein